DPGLFVLRGKALENPGPLCRYLREEDFERMSAAGAAAPAAETRDEVVALENNLLGRPGRPVWCTDATYSVVSDPDVIALDLWPATVGAIVEIAYSHDVLLPDNYVRVATVPDIYWSSSPEFINVKRPALGEGDWCHTVRLDDPALRDRAPSAVHAPLRLLA